MRSKLFRLTIACAGLSRWCERRIYLPLRAATAIGSASLSTSTESCPHNCPYNFDSMGEDDFLTYNREELRAISTGRDSEKKAWLKEFLDTCEDSPIKRELLRLLS